MNILKSPTVVCLAMLPHVGAPVLAESPSGSMFPDQGPAVGNFVVSYEIVNSHDMLGQKEMETAKPGGILTFGRLCDGSVFGRSGETSTAWDGEGNPPEDLRQGTVWTTLLREDDFALRYISNQGQVGRHVTRFENPAPDALFPTPPHFPTNFGAGRWNGRRLFSVEEVWEEAGRVAASDSEAAVKETTAFAVGDGLRLTLERVIDSETGEPFSRRSVASTADSRVVHEYSFADSFEANGIWIPGRVLVEVSANGHLFSRVELELREFSTDHEDILERFIPVEEGIMEVSFAGRTDSDPVTRPGMTQEDLRRLFCPTQDHSIGPGE